MYVLKEIENEIQISEEGKVRGKKNIGEIE